MIINPYRFADTDTTPSGEQLFWLIGDSNADGRGTSIHTIGSGILYNWNGSSYDEITTQTVSNDGSYDSMMRYFAPAYNTSFGNKVLSVCSGHGGTALYNSGTREYWSGGGGTDDVYEPARTVVRAALANKGLTRPKAIFISLGLADALDGVSDANIDSAMTSLITNLTTDFPGSPILWLVNGRLTAVSFNTGLYNLRKRQLEKAEAFTNCHCLSSGCAISLISGGMLADNLHFDNNGLEAWALQFNRWFINSSITNKWSRAVISSHFDELSSGRKTLVDQVVAGLYNRGDYFDLEHFTTYKTTIRSNTYVDWSFLGFGFETGAGFTANTCITTNGTTSYYSYTYFQDINTRSATVTDFIHGAKLKTKVTAVGTIAALFGAGITGCVNNFGQNTTNTIFRAGDNTITNGTETGFVADNLYSVFRNGTTRGLKKNKTTLVSGTVASTGTVNIFPRVGCNNISGVAQNFTSGTFEYVYAAKFSTFDFDSFFDDVENMMTNW